MINIVELWIFCCINMGKLIKYTCDKCGAEIDRGNGFGLITKAIRHQDHIYSQESAISIQHEFYLCKNCTDKIINLI